MKKVTGCFLRVLTQLQQET